MIFKFSLYGFLKNQRYFEPFIMLFFLSKGLTFAQIGILIAFKELFINFIEVPSGSFADLYGRKSAMIFSFVAYIISFVIFSIANSYWQFFFAMFFLATGEAFRTGTHKAIIFSWLRRENRIDEKTKVYGYTRSWSKIGSALSIVLSTTFVLLKSDYSNLFYYAAIPYVLGIINFITYPKNLEETNEQKFNFKEILSHFIGTIKKSFSKKSLRKLIIESMSYEGTFAASKDYIQPIIKNFAIALPIFLALQDKSRIAIIIGIAYLIIYIISALASRYSYRFSNIKGGEKYGTKMIWQISFFVYLILIPILYFKYYGIAIVVFIGFYLLQNIWRPMQISRFDDYASEEEGAAILSIESQAKSLFTMIIAPVFGFLVDISKGSSHGEFFPIAIIGAIVSLVFITAKK